jgi:hypothetical protein
MASERWTHERILEALERGEHLPVGRRDPEWEHNAAVLDDLLHDGFARGPNQSLHDGAGAYFSTHGIRLTDAGRRRLLEAEGHAAAPAARRVGFEARVLTVLIASPGDTVDARDVVEQTILSWNRDRSHVERVVLLPVRWEADAVPEMGSDGQSIINRQLVDRADIVVALFHSRVALLPRGPNQVRLRRSIVRSNGAFQSMCISPRCRTRTAWIRTSSSGSKPFARRFSNVVFLAVMRPRRISQRKFARRLSTTLRHW